MGFQDGGGGENGLCEFGEGHDFELKVYEKRNDQARRESLFEWLTL